MRGNTIFAVENIYLILLAGICALSLFFSISMKQEFGWKIGNSLFQTINYVQILLLVIASPTIVASTFTLEREQKTFDMLLATPLSVGHIARAKLLASLSFFFVLVLVSFPMLAVCFIFGGVSPGEIFWAYLVTAEGILLAGAIGLCYSAFFKRTLASVPMSSLTIIVFLIVTLIIDSFLSGSIGVINPLIAFRVMTSSWTVKFFDSELPFWAPNIILSFFLFMLIYAYTEEVLTDERRRTSVRPRFLLFLFYSAIFTFLMGSTFKSNPFQKVVLGGLASYAYFAFFICMVQAIVVSAGALSTAERGKLAGSWHGKYLRPSGWLKTGFSSGARYSLLVTSVAAAILAVGIMKAPTLEYRLQPILLAGGLLVTCTLAYAMGARFFSLINPTKGKSLPRIVMAICFLGISFLPHLISFAARGDKIEIPNTAWDLPILLSPLVAMYHALDPVAKLEDYPFLEALLQGVPLPLVSICIYAAMLGFFWVLVLFLERRIRYSEMGG